MHRCTLTEKEYCSYSVNIIDLLIQCIIFIVSTTEEHGNTLLLAASNDKSTNNVDTGAQEMSCDELLITCVAQKPALFDHRIPANERSNLKKNTLWQEVSNQMGG